MTTSHILTGDSLDVLKTLDDNSIDSVITDPPYGYSFMGKDWDKAVPSVDIWRECLRVLKPGAFCMVMSAPRSDVQNAMISRLMEAGFRLDFTPIYWTYASGFPKAGNIGKLVDKRLGAEREVIGINEDYLRRKPNGMMTPGSTAYNYSVSQQETNANITAPATPQARALDGSYAGFQPKPAVEVIIVAMKPLSEKTYVDQAMKNGHGVTWLDDCRVPMSDQASYEAKQASFKNSDTSKQIWGSAKEGVNPAESLASGRFPANLLVSDDIINGGIDYSRFFDVDKWAQTLPFLIVPKASKGEKNRGAEKNHHPTVKPLKLMSYLITLTSRPGDVVLDPFVGSGTTAIAAEQLGRIGIGIEREAEYAEIASARLAHVKLEHLPQLPKEEPKPTDTTLDAIEQVRLL